MWLVCTWKVNGNWLLIGKILRSAITCFWLGKCFKLISWVHLKFFTLGEPRIFLKSGWLVSYSEKNLWNICGICLVIW